MPGLFFFLFEFGLNVPLEIIWSGIAVSLVRTERTDVAWRVVHKTVADHLIFALEALSALGAGTALDGAVVWSELRVDICMRAGFLH